MLADLPTTTIPQKTMESEKQKESPSAPPKKIAKHAIQTNGCESPDHTRICAYLAFRAAHIKEALRSKLDSAGKPGNKTRQSIATIC